MHKLTAEEAFERAIAFMDGLGVNVTPSVERQVLALVRACEEQDGVVWTRCADGLHRRFPALWKAFQQAEMRA